MTVVAAETLPFDTVTVMSRQRTPFGQGPVEVPVYGSLAPNVTARVNPDGSVEVSHTVDEISVVLKAPVFRRKARTLSVHSCAYCAARCASSPETSVAMLLLNKPASTTSPTAAMTITTTISTSVNP